MKFPSPGFLVPTAVVVIATAMAVVAQQQFPPSEYASSLRLVLAPMLVAL
jgi:hypothetical protein